MRYTATVRGEAGKKRVLLVEHPQDSRYQGGVVCYLYLDREDGPAEGGEFYDGLTVDQVMTKFEEDYGVQQSDWVAIPDQITGCQDD